ncbi:MAG TPA: MFS transporter, partial [Rhodospirillales bacterium]|nr:MFS transporter [Rhodospirillales bacterium]
FGTGSLAIGLGLIPFSTSLPYLLVAMVFLGIGFSVMSPSLNSLISLQVGAEDQGGIMGVNRSANTLARVLGPAWAGFLFATLGRDWPYFSGALLMGLVVLLAARGLKSFLTKGGAPKAGQD